MAMTGTWPLLGRFPLARIATFWLPALPGWLAFGRLSHREII
jgi:hypothetical protein